MGVGGGGTSAILSKDPSTTHYLIHDLIHWLEIDWLIDWIGSPPPLHTHISGAHHHPAWLIDMTLLGLKRK